MLINVKMPTTVGILTFMSRINFVLSYVEHEKCFKTSGPDLGLILVILCLFQRQEFVKLNENIMMLSNFFMQVTQNTVAVSKDKLPQNIRHW